MLMETGRRHFASLRVGGRFHFILRHRLYVLLFAEVEGEVAIQHLTARGVRVIVLVRAFQLEGFRFKPKACQVAEIV